MNASKRNVCSCSINASEPFGNPKVCLQDVVELLVSAGCPDVILGGGSGGTLPRRRGSVSSARSKEVNSSIL